VRRLQRPPAEERGETLLELVVAIVILGVCVVAIGSGIAVSIKMSDIHRKQAVAQEFLHNDAETIQGQPYVPCTPLTTPDYVLTARTAGLLPDPPNGGQWTISQSAIKYWSNDAFAAGCPTGSGDPGLQQVTLELKSGSGDLVDESLVIVLRSAA
jgi:type II secretory pathway pseudopilin PulG